MTNRVLVKSSHSFPERHGMLTRLLVLMPLAAWGTDRTCRADLRDDVLAAARRATRFYFKEVSSQGGYLWRYSADLALREGEGVADASTVWVQPPGTPAVGEAYVRLYEATSEPLFLEAARAAADALRRGQLRSGGWNDGFSFKPAARKRYAFRTDPKQPGQRNNSSLDDDKTQSVLRFLMQLDRVLQFKDATVHEMTMFGLDQLLAAQYPNGAFPQVWGEQREQPDVESKPARFPDSWPRMYPGHQQYWNRYTLNDNLMPDVISTLFLAEETYGDPKYRAAARKAADFLLLARLPEPQPAWAQQYHFSMEPAWARRFEPPAVSGSESQGILKLLIDLYRRTGDRKYLEPIPRSIAYLKESRLPDGQLARFYELKTNRPLYFTRSYVLTYDDSDLPTHYGFKVPSDLDKIERDYLAVQKQKVPASGKATHRLSNDVEQKARRAIDELDDRGAWVTDDGLRFQKHDGPVINMSVAVRHFNALAAYLAASAP